MLARQRRDRADWLHSADLVVRVHDADERGLAVERLAHGVRIDQAVTVHGNDGDPAAEPLEELARLQRGGMLDGAGDDVRILGPAAENTAQLGEDSSLDRLIARLGAAAREDNLIGLRADQLGDLAASPLDGVVGGFAVAVRAGGIAEVPMKIGEHCFQHSGIDGGGGVAVEIDGENTHETRLFAIGVLRYDSIRERR